MDSAEDIRRNGERERERERKRERERDSCVIANHADVEISPFSWKRKHVIARTETFVKTNLLKKF